MEKTNGLFPDLKIVCVQLKHSTRVSKTEHMVEAPAKVQVC